MEKLTIFEIAELREAVKFYIWAHNRSRTEWLEGPDGVITIDLTIQKELLEKIKIEIEEFIYYELYGNVIIK